METLKEFLHELRHETLMELAKETESLTFDENSLVRFLIEKYNIARDFHTGLIGLKSAILSEIVGRFYGFLKN